MRSLVLTVAAMAAGMAFADKVTLKSGAVLVGKIVGTEGAVVKFESDDFGALNVKKESIAAIEDAEKKPIEVATIAPVPKAPETWHGSVHVAFNAMRGNSYDNTAAIVANVNRKWEKDRFAGDFAYHYGESAKAGEDRQKTADRWEAEVKHDHFWWPKIYHYEDLRYERDMIQLLRARYRVGLGGGYQWLDNDDFEATGKWSFNQELGANWIKEDFEDNDDTAANGFCGLRYAHHLLWTPKWADGVSVFHNAEVLPDAEEWEKFLSKCDLGLSTKVFLDIDLLAKMEWEYNSMPADDRHKSDLRYLLGLGYKW